MSLCPKQHQATLKHPVATPTAQLQPAALLTMSSTSSGVRLRGGDLKIEVALRCTKTRAGDAAGAGADAAGAAGGGGGGAAVAVGFSPGSAVATTMGLLSTRRTSAFTSATSSSSGSSISAAAAAGSSCRCCGASSPEWASLQISSMIYGAIAQDESQSSHEGGGKAEVLRPSPQKP